MCDFVVGACVLACNCVCKNVCICVYLCVVKAKLSKNNEWVNILSCACLCEECT